MKRTLASLVATAAIMPLFWYNIIPWAKDYCPRNAQGKVEAYSVQRPDGFGHIVTLMFGGEEQNSLCTMVQKYPA